MRCARNGATQSRVTRYGRPRSTSLFAVTIWPEGGFSTAGSRLHVDPPVPIGIARAARNRQHAIRTGANRQQSRHRVADVAVDIGIHEVLRGCGEPANRVDELPASSPRAPAHRTRAAALPSSTGCHFSASTVSPSCARAATGRRHTPRASRSAFRIGPCRVERTSKIDGSSRPLTRISWRRISSGTHSSPTR